MERRDQKEKQVSFNLIARESSSVTDCLRGSLQSDVAKLSKSYVEASESQIKNLQQLVLLSNTCDTILKVDHATTLDDGTVLMSTETATRLEEYFDSKRKQNIYSDDVKKWAAEFEATFFVIFSDIKRALMHLFIDNKACGKIQFNMFVTSENRGRLLPSMETINKGYLHTSQKTDLNMLVQIMKKVTLQFHPYKPPEALFNLVRLVCDPSLTNVPRIVMVDHPYFYTTRFKVSFIFRLRKFLKQRKMKAYFRSTLLFRSKVTYVDYKDWRNKLQGTIYEKIYLAAQKKAKPYTETVDIIRFFGAVLTHADEEPYWVAGRALTEDEIVHDIGLMFDGFFLDMFETLCRCGYMNTNKDVLLSMSTIYSRTSDRPENIPMRAVPAHHRMT